MLHIVKKYQQQKTEIAVQTDTDTTDKEKEKVSPTVKHQHTQADLETNTLNNSKLSSAQELLKNTPLTLQPICPRCEENKINLSNREEPKKKITTNNSQQVSTEIVKMVKEIASLKRLVTESDKQCKLR